MSWSFLHRFVFTTALTITSRVVLVRDHLVGRVPRKRPECPEISVKQHTIPSGKNLIDAVYVVPADEPAQSAILICHGIGEIVPQWFAVQRILAQFGGASLLACPPVCLASRSGLASLRRFSTA